MRNQKTNFSLCIAFFMLGLLPQVHASKTDNPVEINAIYGPDDRHEAYELPKGIYEVMSRATVAIFPFWAVGGVVGSNESFVSVASETIQTRHNLCSDEAFVHQPAGPFCSGLLIGKDLVLTAGHCVRNGLICHGQKFVFDYRVAVRGQIPWKVPKTSIYGCREVIAVSNEDGLDYAIVKLDREVQDRAYYPVSKKVNPLVGDEVFMMGYPLGLPQKITVNGRIRQMTTGKIITDLDALKNNSGSPVFLRKSGLVIGVLTDGEIDFVYDKKNDCNHLNRCPQNSCSGEFVQDIRAL